MGYGLLIAVAVVSDLALLAPSLLQETFYRATASRAIEKTLQPGSIIAGQFAPQLAFGTSLESVYVQPGLANDRDVVRRERVDYVLVTDSKYWNSWWDRAYPGLRDDQNRIGHVVAGDGYDVVIYQPAASPKWFASANAPKRGYL